MRARIIIPMLFFLALAMAPVSAYTISGDKITYEGVFGKITQEPFLLEEISNEVELQFTSYFEEAEYLDIGFGFDIPNAKPTTALYFSPHTEYNEITYICDGFANWTVDPNYMWCWNEILDNDTQETYYELEYGHSFATGNVQTKTITWLQPYNVDYVDISDKFTKINYDWNGKNTWYFIENVEFQPDQTKVLKLFINALPDTETKYDIFVKRNEDSFTSAISNNKYVLLDPWINVSWDKCKNISITNLAGTIRNNEVHIQNITDIDYSLYGELRIVNKSCSDGGSYQPYQWLRNGTGWVQVLYYYTGATNTTWSVYYDNPTADQGNSTLRVYYNDASTNISDFTVADTGYAQATCPDAGSQTISNEVGVSIFSQGTGASNFNCGTHAYVTAGFNVTAQPLTILANQTVTKRNSGSGGYMGIGFFNSNSNNTRNSFDVFDSGSDYHHRSTIMEAGGSTVDSTDIEDINPLLNKLMKAYFTGSSFETYVNGTFYGKTQAYSGWEPSFVAYPEMYSIARANNDVLQANWTEFGVYVGNASMYMNPITTTLGSEETNSRPPLWSLNASTYPANYDATATVLNITWANGSATEVVNITDVYITSNYSGSNTSYNVALVTGNEITGNYSQTALIGAGTYFWGSNATSNLTTLNTTPDWLFTIGQYTSTCDVVTGHANDSTVTYPIAVTTYGTCDNPEGTWKLYMNGTDITAQNNTPLDWGAGQHYFVSNVTGTQNYTTFHSFIGLIINKGNLSNVSLMNITFNDSTPIQNEPVNVTCNIPVGITSNEFKLYNDTHEIGNVTGVVGTSGLGLFNFTCNSTGNANWTSGEATNSFTVVAPGGLLIDAVYDELTLGALTFNMTLFNSTFSSTSININNYNNDTVLGTLTATISADGYGTRSYYVTIAQNASFNLTGYLLPTASGQWVTLTVSNILEEPLEDSEINITRIMTSGVEIIAQGVTDSAGGYPFFLDPTNDYGISITKEEYEDKTTSLIPVETAYTIYLYQTIASAPSFFSYYGNISTSCAFTNASRTLSCTWNDTSTYLSAIWLNITQVDTTSSYQVCSNTSASSSGTMNCVLPSNYINKTYPWSLFGIFITDEDTTGIMLDSGAINVRTGTIDWGYVGLFASFLIILSGAMIGFEHGPAIGIVLTVAGLVASYYIGFIRAPEEGIILIISGLIAVAGLIISNIEKLEKDG